LAKANGRSVYDSAVPLGDRQDHAPLAPRRLNAEEAEVVRGSLAHPIGRYDSERASQLSGIPRRTVNYWFQHELLVPDDEADRRWSYRDLVFLRVFAWLRTKKMPPDAAALRVRTLKRALLGDGAPITRVRSQGKVLLLGNESVDRWSGEMVFSEVAPFFSHLDLVALTGSADMNPGRYEGPDLLRPRSRITIRPWVLSGEPCIRGTRIPTAAMYAINHERGLEPDQIVRLYPGTTRVDITQAIDLETTLRAAA
jgi:uncharacterized protein (DUF433 family)